MLITARLCLEKGYRFALCCPRCTSLRVFYAGFARAVIERGQGDRPLAELFERGALVCRRHRLAASFLSVAHDRDSTVDQIACWRRSAPSPGAGAQAAERAGAAEDGATLAGRSRQ